MQSRRRLRLSLQSTGLKRGALHLFTDEFRLEGRQQGHGLGSWITQQFVLWAIGLPPETKDIQTAKEHNIREIGLRLLSLKESGLNQKEIAEQEGLSQAKVTRAVQAATVPQELIDLPPSPWCIALFSQCFHELVDTIHQLNSQPKANFADISVLIRG